MEDRDVQPLTQLALEVEAPRGRDVLEVDPTEARRHPRDRVDELVDRAGLEADRDGVHAGEVLEEDRLALHDGHRRERADVPQTEHGRAVGDDGDRVVARGVLPGEGLC